MKRPFSKKHFSRWNWICSLVETRFHDEPHLHYQCEDEKGEGDEDGEGRSRIEVAASHVCVGTVSARVYELQLGRL